MALIKSIAGNEICDQTCRNTVNDISIGGENLLSNSKLLTNFIKESKNVTWQNNVLTRTGDGSSPWGIYYDYKEFESGNTYTLSVETRDITGSIRLSAGNTSGGWNQYAETYFSANGRHSITFTLSSDVSALRLYIASTVSGSSAKITKVKLERGNKPTDWSPAPEDICAMTDDGNGNVTIGIY